MKNIITFFLLFSFVLSINGQEVDSWEELVSQIQINGNNEVSIGYLRNGQLYLTTTVLEERLVGNTTSGYLGVSPTVEL